MVKKGLAPEDLENPSLRNNIPRNKKSESEYLISNSKQIKASNKKVDKYSSPNSIINISHLTRLCMKISL